MQFRQRFCKTIITECSDHFYSVSVFGMLAVTHLNGFSSCLRGCKAHAGKHCVQCFPWLFPVPACDHSWGPLCVWKGECGWEHKPRRVQGMVWPCTRGRMAAGYSPRHSPGNPQYVMAADDCPLIIWNVLVGWQMIQRIQKWKGF